jgi:phosphoribosylanthranilate isomerase
MIKAIKQRLNKPIIKAISICSEKDVDLSETFKPFCEMILFDTKLQTPEIRGGSGISFNWNLLEKYKSKKKWMLAGGLNIKNLKKAVELTGAPIVDISSGVEVEKGVKCPEKIKELIRYVKKSRFTKI